VIGQPTAQRLRRRHGLVAIFVESHAFLREVALAEEAVAAADDDRLGDAVADGRWFPRKIQCRSSGTEGFDPADDFVAEDRRRRPMPAAGVGMEVTSTKGTCQDANQDFPRSQRGRRHFGDFQLGFWAIEVNCPTHHGAVPEV
jgi:hypothetical protein